MNALNKFAAGFCFAALCVASCPAQESKPMTEQGLEELLGRMTMREKIGQLNFVRITEPDMEKLVRAGDIGGFLNVRDHAQRENLERIAAGETRLKIPLLHGADVIHGYRTIFPIPLGQAATWNVPLIEGAARIAAQEATAGGGIRWFFSPMVDVARDARWGRMAEGFGEDPFLTGTLGAAMVRGYQGTNLRAADSVAACPKHYAGYAGSEGGRDYNTVDVSERTLRDIHLAPFKMCLDAGAPTVMSAFSEVNGEPVTGSKFLLTDILRGEWKFPGFVVSDAKAVEQLVAHGRAVDNRDAARLAILAGLDVEIFSTCYHDYLASLVDEGAVPVETVNEAVRRVLRVKWQLGLFDKPVTPSGGPDTVPLSAEHLAAAREAARESIVLLKNEKQTLPLKKDIKSVAVIGPLADAGKDQLGCWMVYGKAADTQTPLQALRETLGKDRVHYAPGLPAADSTDVSKIAEAVAAAKSSSAAILFLGEPANYSGEAHNRACLTLPGAQSELLRAVQATGKPVIVVLMSGRPLEIGPALDASSALLMAWHPGTMGGPAIADVLFGDYNPAGRLPISWPRAVGQIPIHYNHQNSGRPNPLQFSPAINAETQLDTGHVTGYLDLPSVPQFPFGFGLSYTNFEYADAQLSGAPLQPGEAARITARVTNSGDREGDEVVQLYLRDLVGSVPRPVRELKGFQRIHLAAGESKMVEFVLSKEALAFHNLEMKRVTEPGKFRAWIAPDSASGTPVEFELK